MNFTQILEGKPATVRQAAIKLRELIMDHLPQLDENIYGGKKVKNALYSKASPSRVVCGIQTSSQYCMLYLHKTDQVDTNGLKLEGKGKHARHVKFNSAEEVDPGQVIPVIQSIEKVS
ncbi:MAG: DUF1801 domain-containing protein [Candidatus Cyclobacteriaceae bacterium M3_2C_046]